MRTRTIILLAVLAVCAVPCFADWGQAESLDFVLDTTVPEPALLGLLALVTVVTISRVKVQS
ncbi:MAG: PEP-CTERM sorting domain-containing protein [bacterium]|nr:PEP-CTERM sorting domain-containing protein [bacterium]